MITSEAYIVAARRTAIGRVGGLHRSRRIEDLTTPVIGALIGDCKINPALIDGLILGNASGVANPARLIALAAGLPEQANAITIDRQCASGLDAVVQACRMIGSGDGEVLIAGGAEAISTAPWRVAKPRYLHQLPRFLGHEYLAGEGESEGQQHEASDHMARSLGIERAYQDQIALRSHMAAIAARDARQLVGEIVPLRNTTEEARDELVRDLDLDDLERQNPFSGPGWGVTAGNSSQPGDGAALVMIVSPRIWRDLGEPKALRLLGSANSGVAPDQHALAAVAATKRLIGLHNDIDLRQIGAIEMSETTAAQLIAFAQQFGIDPTFVNAGGGAIARGHPYGAAGAVLVVRLFSILVRAARGDPSAKALQSGLAALSAIGGLGAAALFEATA